MTLTPAEVQHIKEALGDYHYLIAQEPSLIIQRQEDRLSVALEIMGMHRDSQR